MKKKFLYWVTGVAIIVFAFVFSNYLINAKPAPRKDNKQHNTVYVKARTAELVETKSDMSYRGRITAFDNVSLAAEVQGKIMPGDVRFKEGESFSKGDVLLNIYKEDIEASLKSGKSSFLQTLSAILPDIKIDYPEEYEKWNTFFKDLDVEQPLPELPTINSNKEKVFLAANNVLAGYYNLQQSELNLTRYTIKAPFNGSFKMVNKEIGAVASPGVELATIIRTDKLEVTVSVFPKDLNWIKKGDKVTVIDNKGNNKTVTVSRISGFVDEATQSVNIYLTYQSKRNTGFLQGQYVDVHFAGNTVKGFEIPREALVDENFVYVLKDKNLDKVEIEILRQLDDSYIISGLNANSIVVTESLASTDSNSEYQVRD